MGDGRRARQARRWPMNDDVDDGDVADVDDGQAMMMGDDDDDDDDEGRRRRRARR